MHAANVTPVVASRYLGPIEGSSVVFRVFIIYSDTTSDLLHNCQYFTFHNIIFFSLEISRSTQSVTSVNWLALTFFLRRFDVRNHSKFLKKLCFAAFLSPACFVLYQFSQKPITCPPHYFEIRTYINETSFNISRIKWRRATTCYKYVLY